jgi:hypothetical protein
LADSVFGLIMVESLTSTLQDSTLPLSEVEVEESAPPMLPDSSLALPELDLSVPPMIPDSSLQEVEEIALPATALPAFCRSSPHQKKVTALPFSSDATVLPARWSSPHQQKVSRVATALPAYSLPSPGDIRKHGATSTKPWNKMQKIATPESTITPMNEAESKVAPMNVSEAESRTPVKKAEVEEEQVCWLCGGTPCDWVEYLAEWLQEVEEKFPLDGDRNRIDALTQEDVSNNRIRYALYRTFTYAWYGRLGRKNRMKLGKCAEDKIKELFLNNWHLLTIP